MYCKKCKYHAFDHVSACPKCGTDWEETRKALYLNWLTSRGHDWFAVPEQQTTDAVETPPAAVTAAQAPVQETYLDLGTPTTPPRSEDIEVALLPDLDFGLDTPASATAHEATQADSVASKPSGAADDKSKNDIVELDFGLSVDTTPPAPPKAAPRKRDDLFIPELEEMLAPMAEESKATPVKKSASKTSADDDIYLDFSREQKSTPSKPDIAELDLLDFDIKK